jgi:hypothetical protein
MAVEIPKDIRPPKGVNPNFLIIYSSPKAGKTVICSQLKDHLILELEAGGADFIQGRVMELNKPSEFNEAIASIRDSPAKVCDYLVVDTITKTDEWSEIVGTYSYMNKVQGKKFNRDENGNKILHTSPEFETVHSLKEGYGYQHSRQVMVDWYDKLWELIGLGKVKHVILIAHIKDKLIETKNGDAVESFDVNLTGKVKSIYAARVDAIGFLHRKDTKAYLNFDNDYKVVCGGRCAHLNGEILISEKQADGTIKTFWENIFLINK